MLKQGKKTLSISLYIAKYSTFRVSSFICSLIITSLEQMFSSSVLNITAGCFSPTTDYYHHPHQQQYLQESTYSDVFSGHESSISGCLFHHYPTPPLALVVPYADDHDVPDIFTTVNTCSVENTPMHMMPEQSAAGAAVAPIKKSDSRSKVRTAQGLRDRRVRLSIGTARKFFDLQDLLGFDKPSETLEWLLKKSNKAILKLSAGSSSSTTSSEASLRRYDGLKISLFSSPSTTATYNSNQTEGMSSCASLKTAKHKKALLQAKESRAKARARARARTVAKLNHQQLQLQKNPVDKSRGDQTSYLSRSCHNNLSRPSTGKSLVIFESGKEEHGQVQKQQLSLHNLNSAIKIWSDFNASLPLDHCNNFSNVFPQPSASLVHQLNLWSRDVDTNGQARWDYN